MIHRLASLFVALVAVVATGGCITDPVTGRSVVGAPISEAEEEQMGLQYKPAIVQQFDGPYPDAALQDHLGKIVLGMAHRSVRPDLPWTFTVLNTSVPNAFAVPGGQVFVTRGLLTEMEDEAEFAVVMGHELGHVEHRHSVQQQGQQLLVGVAASAAAATWGDTAGQGVAVAGQLGILLPYSRADETESDVRGIENSYAAGYDPRQGADVFRTFLKMKKEAGDGTPTWLSTHPADEERIQNVLRLSAAKDPRLAGSNPVPGLRVTTPTWGQLIARLRSEQETYDRYDAAMKAIGDAKGSKASIQAAIPAFRQCARDLPGHALLHATLGKALIISGDTRNGQSELERASSMNQQLFEPEYLLGALALESKDWNRAGSYAQRGLAVLPENYLCLYVRGEASWNMGRKAEAEQDLRAVLETAPDTSEEYKSAASRLGVTTDAAKAPKKAPAKAATTRKKPR